MTFVAIDFETADEKPDSACAIGLVRVEGDQVVRKESRLIRPPRSLIKFTYVHGLTWKHLEKQLPFQAVWTALTDPRGADMLRGADALVAHNASFDRGVLTACCEASGHKVPSLRWICTLQMARDRWPRPFSNKLPDVCRRLEVPMGSHHEAGSDAEACARILIALRTAQPDRSSKVTAPPPPVDPHPTLTALVAEGLLDPKDLARWVAQWQAERLRNVRWFCRVCGGLTYWFCPTCPKCVDREEQQACKPVPSASVPMTQSKSTAFA